MASAARRWWSPTRCPTETAPGRRAARWRGAPSRGARGPLPRAVLCTGAKACGAIRLAVEVRARWCYGPPPPRVVLRTPAGAHRGWCVRSGPRTTRTFLRRVRNVNSPGKAFHALSWNLVCKTRRPVSSLSSLSSLFPFFFSPSFSYFSFFLFSYVIEDMNKP